MTRLEAAIREAIYPELLALTLKVTGQPMSEAKLANAAAKAANKATPEIYAAIKREVMK